MQRVRVLLLQLVLQSGVLGQSVHYEDPRCAVKDSTVTIPCTFQPLQPIIRVRWCVNHGMCQGPTPSLYDSDSPHRYPRYRYLGDKTGNCSLQIRNVELRDSNIYRFRMEAGDSSGHFTGVQGASVTVIGDRQMRISSSSDVNSSRVGDTIVLNCSNNCTFHDLSIIWKKDNTTLAETGPVLTLGPLTEGDSGRYSCGLQYKSWTTSETFTLQIRTGVSLSLVLGVLAAVLLVVGMILLFVFFIRRRGSAVDTPEDGQPKTTEDLYSRVSHSKSQDQHRTMEGDSDVAYAAVQFKPSSSKVETDESVIYSSVVTQR